MVEKLRENASQHHERVQRLNQEIEALHETKQRKIEVIEKMKLTQHKVMKDLAAKYELQGYDEVTSWYMVYSMSEDWIGLDKFLELHKEANWTYAPFRKAIQQKAAGQKD